MSISPVTIRRPSLLNTESTSSNALCWTTVYLSIGSNMGDKHQNCLQGIALLDGLDRITVEAISPFYRTEPVDFTDQDWFVNGALKIGTDLHPDALMDQLKEIERELGQFKKSVRFGPRILDLDIIFYGEEILETDRVILPHPRMHQRNFVLTPLCDIAPEVIHPVLKIGVRALLGDVVGEPEQAVVPL